MDEQSFDGMTRSATALNDILADLEGRSRSFGSVLTGALRQAVSGSRGLEDILRGVGARLADIALSVGLKPLETLAANTVSGLLGGLGGGAGGSLGAGLAGGLGRVLSAGFGGGTGSGLGGGLIAGLGGSLAGGLAGGPGGGLAGGTVAAFAKGGIFTGLPQAVMPAAAAFAKGGIVALLPQASGGGALAGGGSGARLPQKGAGVFAFGGGGSVTPFAQGGVVAAPTYFAMEGGRGLMGEAGPEAILPLRRGSDGALGVAASGVAASSGSGPVQVVFNITTPDAESFRRSEGQIAAMLARSVGRGQRNI